MPDDLTWPDVFLVRRPAYTHFPAQHTKTLALAEAYVRMWSDDSVPPTPADDIERYVPLETIRERLREHYGAGAESLRRFRLGIHYDENGLEMTREQLPEYLCSGDTIAALRCLNDILDAAFPEDTEHGDQRRGR